ncbi:MAG: hypothetical protein M1825_001171 [Sarcosagium campestre]|nr:MAG: hypothetical protein M1825_001171 [Sarcosagium campestre]
MSYSPRRQSKLPLTGQTVHSSAALADPEPQMSRRQRSLPPYTRLLCIFVFGVTLIVYLLRPAAIPIDREDFVGPSIKEGHDYFDHFEGHQDCGISSHHLYIPPLSQSNDGKVSSKYCRNRKSLLEALSEGGRHGFEAPFVPKGCHYRWYSTAEICMILDRFDGLVFVGDGLVRQIYAAFNILLRENVALGALQQWAMSDEERASCRCENQYVKSDCSKFAVESSSDVEKNDANSAHRSPYTCNRTPHFYLSVGGSPASEEHTSRMKALLTSSPDSYKPIPIVYSLSLSTSLSWHATTASMDEFLGLADTASDTAMRPMPFLWLGPVAAGHLKPPGQILNQGNNALWHYTHEMAKEARTRNWDVLNLYNLTLQADSWDGSAYGERVALVQAMMVVNWLSKLEST